MHARAPLLHAIQCPFGPFLQILPWKNSSWKIICDCSATNFLINYFIPDRRIFKSISNEFRVSELMSTQEISRFLNYRVLRFVKSRSWAYSCSCVRKSLGCWEQNFALSFSHSKLRSHPGPPRLGQGGTQWLKQYTIVCQHTATADPRNHLTWPHAFFRRLKRDASTEQTAREFVLHKYPLYFTTNMLNFLTIF